jgi:pyruvate-ferredoxin/flavodoxin oxidoreductase
MSDSKKMVMIDGNTAAAHVAHALSEVIAIYPITPSSPMGELADEFSAQGRKNIWGTIPQVVEMQSEAGAAGAAHGALTSGALTTTFTASQGLLLMIPNMYKIAGECTSAVFHIAARAVAAHALSIYGDHQDIMAARATGWAMLAGNNVQEVMDMALVAHASTLEARVPFINFFDGFRTSHEVAKVEETSYDVMKQMINDELVRAHRARGLSPEHPEIRGTSQNPDVYFTSREASNKLYDAVPAIVEKNLEKLGKLVGRNYKLFEYYGAPDADRVVVVMGSGADVCKETADYLLKKGEKVGVLSVRLFRPFSVERFVAALPASVKTIAVLDRTKEPGAIGEPLYEDVRTAIGEMMGAGKAPFKAWPTVIGGRYGLGSAEFTPTMAKAVFDELKAKEPKNHFCVGPDDDVTHTSLAYDPSFHIETEGEVACLFYGLGSDGTVGANKNSIKIIGDDTPNSAQGYFFYDSKKAGTYTISHLRFGPKKIDKPYLITKADFIACHKFAFLEKLDMLKNAKDGGVFLLNSPYPADKVWDEVPVEVQKTIIAKKLKFYVVDGMAIAEKAGMGSRINTIMQTAFFKISGVLPSDEALKLIKKYTEKTYSKKGADVVAKNIAAIDLAVNEIYEVKYPAQANGKLHMKSPVPADAPKFVKEVLGAMIANEGESLKVSQLPMDGTFPTGTTKYERRNIAEKIPVWNPEICIQCGNCTMVCPHAVIRLKAYDAKEAAGAPKTFKVADAKGKEFAGMKATLQVAPEDCTGCGACVNICPVTDKADPAKKAINLEHQIPLREPEAANWEFFKKIPNTDSKLLNLSTAKGIAMREPLFEFSGACAGCGETPYVKMMSQLFGDRAIIANATGCSSIYGGNLPTTPYTKRADGRGPAWSNSLFEDAAEFGMGMRMAADKRNEYARELLVANKATIGAALADRILANKQAGDEEIEAQRANVAELKKALAGKKEGWAAELSNVAEDLIRKSVWTFGGDGWAYDIGYGGLDHVLASGRDINIMVLDTEVYSNTGGQMSKATPIGAIAKFAAAGKDIGKKDLGAMAMAYGYVYVAQVSMGANMAQAIKAFREAESYDGPSIVIAYSHCINQGIDMMKGMNQQKLAVESGVWPLYRYDPRLKTEGKNPFQLDSKEPDMTKIETYVYNEVRFKSLKAANPERAATLLAKQKASVERRWKEYRYIADRPF